ncbi:hypothetical protein DRP44_00195 [candidate division TA06 bacterium]|uniref:Uncharacterized protein n=1 Tax=candidate division TA06 bacterium TaxID=2250710 RepID=A0A660SBK7_UNCT6|nr:MAG: hypothetical protein DRP44_00195 [candidate division TA06 bacterium]
MSNKLIEWSYMKKCILFLLLIPLAVYGTEYAGEYYNLPSSAITVSSGNSIFFSDLPVVFAISPVNITPDENRFISYNHISASGLFNDDNLIFSTGNSSNRVSFMLKLFHSGGIPITVLPDTTDTIGPNNQPIVDHYASYNHSNLLLNYSKAINRHLSVGFNIRADYIGFENATGFGMGIDGGIRYTPDNKFYCALGVKNISTTVIFWNNGTKDVAYPETQLSLGYSFHVAGNRLNTYIGLPFHFDNRGTSDQFHYDSISFDLNAGLDFFISNIFRLSMGIYQNNPTMGAGFSYKRFMLDYSFFINNELGAGNIITVSYKF